LESFSREIGREWFGGNIGWERFGGHVGRERFSGVISWEGFGGNVDREGFGGIIRRERFGGIISQVLAQVSEATETTKDGVIEDVASEVHDLIKGGGELPLGCRLRVSGRGMGA